MNRYAAYQIELLERAKIELPHSVGICQALKRAAEHLRHAYRSPAYWARLRLENYILDDLGNHTYLSAWLIANGMADIAQDPGKLLQARLQWIDWMIACLKEDNP